LKFLSDI